MERQLMKKLLLAAISTTLLTGAAHAAPMQCTRKTTTARILQSANPNDTAPDWQDGNVGTGMGFVVKRTVNAETGKYFQGDLISTRGSAMDRNVFILAQDWNCGS
jgi:hypothetical protein